MIEQSCIRIDRLLKRKANLRRISFPTIKAKMTPISNTRVGHQGTAPFYMRIENAATDELTVRKNARNQKR